MRGSTDDDAFRWEGDDEAAAAAAAARRAPTPAVDADVSHAAVSPADVTHAAVSPVGNVALVGTGILAGFSALFTIGWIVGGLRLQTSAQFLIAPVAFWVSLWLAVAAPALWFVTTWMMTRGSSAGTRFAWLTVGALLLIPWPFVMIGAVGQ